MELINTQRTLNINPSVELKSMNIYVKTLCMLLIYSTLEASKLLMHNIHMHNLHTISVKVTDICRRLSDDLVNETGNIMIAVSSVIEDISVKKYDRILFETANIKLECPYRLNRKDWKPLYVPFAKARKRTETVFYQLADQFMIIRNYAKETEGLFVRIIGTINDLTILQYINKVNCNPDRRIKEELSDSVVVANFATTTRHGAIEGKTQVHDMEYYNLDVVISVGYRVKSKSGVEFLRNCTQLFEYSVCKGV